MAKHGGAVLDRPGAEKQERESCRHYWEIEPAFERLTSVGICKYCGAQKVFFNIVESTESKEDLNRFFDKDMAIDDKETEDLEEAEESYELV